MKVAYLINQYPKVSHAFIRREIRALEDAGAAVERISLRGWNEALSDADDAAERARTAYVLRERPLAIAAAVLTALWHNPRGFLAALGDCARLMRRSHRARIYHLIYLAEACVVARWIGVAGVDHLHAHFGTNSAEVALLAHHLTGIPFSFTVHGPDEFDKPESFGLAAKAARASFVCAVSSFGRSQLFRWLRHADWPKVKVVHCGLDRTFLAPPAEAPPPAGRLVSVGRLSGQKGQLLLVEAAARLVAEGRDLTLVLAGDGEMRPEIERLIAERRLASRVRITGWIGSAEVAAEIRAARALVLPSFAEGLPVVLMEALALERPVITTYVAGIPELVRDGISGWLVPAGDVERLAEAMARALDAPDEAIRAMGRAGRAAVVANHDAAAEAAKLRALFAAAAARPAGAIAPAPAMADVETT